VKIPTPPDVQALIAEDRWQELRETVAPLPPPEVADLVEQLDEPDRVRLYSVLPRRSRYETFPHLSHETQRAIWTGFSEEEARQLLHNLEPDDRTRLLEQLPEEAREHTLSLLTPLEAYGARQLLAYPEESVGRLMSPEFVALRASWTVEHALRHIRAQSPAPEVIATIYVTDADFKLIDMLELPRLVLSDPETLVQDIIDGNSAALSPEDDRETAVQAMLKYDAVALPVVDREGIMVGVVTVDDVFDVAEEEATEDFQKQAAVAPLKASYLEVRVWPLFLKRIPWLAALVFVYLGASGVISAFEDALSAEIVLASFIPLLMGSGGNVGAQSATLAVRALATGELRGGSWLRALVKELAVGLVIGLAMGVLAAGVGHLRGGFEIAGVVAAAMVFIVIVANIFGIMLPLLLDRIGIDPAVAGNPLITSCTDVTSLLIYFGLATQLMGL
jgi:magnesium transporter